MKVYLLEHMTFYKNTEWKNVFMYQMLWFRQTTDCSKDESVSLFLQVGLLCVASQHGDLQSVSYLLREARIILPQEPSSSNPAILAAHYGHASVVKELLDSIPGKRKRDGLRFMMEQGKPLASLVTCIQYMHWIEGQLMSWSLLNDIFIV